MTDLEKLIYLKDNEYIINSKFYVVVHLPLGSLYDFDLVFFADSGSVTHKSHIQNVIDEIIINDENKTARITFSED